MKYKKPSIKDLSNFSLAVGAGLCSNGAQVDKICSPNGQNAGDGCVTGSNYNVTACHPTGSGVIG